MGQASKEGLWYQLQSEKFVHIGRLIKQILEHLGLAATAPRLMQARGPPQAEQSDFFAQEFFEDLEGRWIFQSWLWSSFIKISNSAGKR